MSTTSVSHLMHRSSTSSSVSTVSKPYATSSVKAIKLLRFFGDTPPMDVSIGEIQRHGLKAMLQSKLPLCYFLHALLNEYTSENLFFMLEVERYQATPFTHIQAQINAAHAILHTYLSPNASCLEINIDHKIRHGVWEKLKQLSGPGQLQVVGQLRQLFEPCKAHVMQLLDMSFATFTKSSPLYAQMVKDLKSPKSENVGIQVYDHKAKRAAVQVLAQYFIDHELVDPPSPDIEEVLNHPNLMMDSSPLPVHPSDVGANLYMINSYIQSATTSSLHTSNLLRGEPELNQKSMLDPKVNRAILRRMLQGFALTMLNVDLIQLSVEILN